MKLICQRRGCGKEFQDKKQKTKLCPSCRWKGFKSQRGKMKLSEVDLAMLKLSERD